MGCSIGVFMCSIFILPNLYSGKGSFRPAYRMFFLRPGEKQQIKGEHPRSAGEMKLHVANRPVEDHRRRGVTYGVVDDHTARSVEHTPDDRASGECFNNWPRA